MPKTLAGRDDKPAPKAQSWRSSQLKVARAKASVAMASSRPRSLRAGSPTAADTTAPTAPPHSSPSTRLPVSTATRTPATAPMAAKATWPSESCPARPVRKLTEMPMVAKATTVDSTNADRLLMPRGTSAAATAAAPPTTQPRFRISQTSRYESGRRRLGARLDQRSGCSRPARTWRATPARMSTNRAISNQPVASGLEIMICSTMPMPKPARSAMGRLANRARAATANPRMMKSGPRASAVTVDWLGMMSMAANAAMAPASAHESMAMCRGSTPAKVAESGLAAAPRMARPKRLRWRNR